VKNELENFQATEQGKAQEQLEEIKNQIKKDQPHWFDKHGNIDSKNSPITLLMVPVRRIRKMII